MPGGPINEFQQVGISLSGNDLQVFEAVNELVGGSAEGVAFDAPNDDRVVGFGLA